MTRTIRKPEEPVVEPSRRRRTKAIPSMKVVESRMRVSASIYGTEDEYEEVDVHAFVTEPAYVNVTAGTTKNLGNYESLKVAISYTVPCYREQMEQVADVLGDTVAARLEDEVSKYLGEDD